MALSGSAGSIAVMTAHSSSPQVTQSILIVDDEPGVRKALAKLLRNKGYAVSLAGSVQEAISELTREVPSLLITDIHMPDGSGLDLARYLKEYLPEVPFLIMTGKGEMETAIDAVRLHAADYLLKPFKQGELTEVVARILRERARIRDREERILAMEQQLLAQKDGSHGLHFGNVYSLVEALEAKDPYTRGHSHRVTRFALSIAEGLGDRVNVDKLRLAATLHDIGKIGVRGATLNKDGPLSEEEWRHVQDHCVIGERIVLPATDDEEILGAIRSHHERWDGTGYPDGLAGEEIPILARIIAIADTLDAMTTERAYRGALSRMDALAEIRAMAGSQFDPEIAGTAWEIMGRWWWPGRETLYRSPPPRPTQPRKKSS